MTKYLQNINIAVICTLCLLFISDDLHVEPPLTFSLV